MAVQLGQKVYVPNPEGDGQLLATIIALGRQGDGVDVLIAGKPVKRDVAIVQYEEGERKGSTGRVPYPLIAAESK